jgi:hypothetical protein
MRTQFLTVFVATGALVASGLVVAAPASAATAIYGNSYTTADPTDLDITSLEVSFSDEVVAVTARVQNIADLDAYAFYLTDKPGFTGAIGTNLIGFRVGLEGGLRYDGLRKPPGTTKPVYFDAASYVQHSLDTTASTITLSMSSADVPWDGSAYVSAQAYVGVAPSFAAALVAEGEDPERDFTGFGPLSRGVTETSVSLSASASQITAGESVTATARVSPSDAVGTVEFRVGTQVLGTVAATGGVASLALPALAVGAHGLTAAFTPSESRNFSAAGSSAVVLTVLAPATVPPTTITKTKTRIKLSAARQHFQERGAKVKVRVPGKPGGTIVIYDGKRKLTSVTLAKGKATYRLPKKLTVGAHKISARFVPSTSGFSASTSRVVKLRVRE